MSDDAKILEDIGEYKYGFHDRDDNYTFKSEKGLSREVVENISRMKGEPEWMLEFRLKAFEQWLKMEQLNVDFVHQALFYHLLEVLMSIFGNHMLKVIVGYVLSLIHLIYYKNYRL